MLKARSKQPESLSAHLKQIRGNVDNFSERNEGDFLMSSHTPGALFYLSHAAALGGILLFGIGYFVVRFITDSGLVRNSMLFAAGACLVYNFVADRYTKKRQVASNGRVKVGLGAVIMAHQDCWDPEAEGPVGGACMLITDDPELEADPDRLIQTAQRIFALRETAEEETPAEMRAIRSWLVNDGKTPDNSNPPMPVAESFAGSKRTWVQGVAVFRDRMPDAVIDRPLFPVMWDGEDAEVYPENMELEMWWWDEVDRLFYASADEGSAARAEEGEASAADGDEGVA